MCALDLQGLIPKFVCNWLVEDLGLGLGLHLSDTYLSLRISLASSPASVNSLIQKKQQVRRRRSTPRQRDRRVTKRKRQSQCQNSRIARAAREPAENEWQKLRITQEPSRKRKSSARKSRSTPAAGLQPEASRQRVWMCAFINPLKNFFCMLLLCWFGLFWLECF